MAENGKTNGMGIKDAGLGTLSHHMIILSQKDPNVLRRTIEEIPMESQTNYRAYRTIVEEINRRGQGYICLVD